MKLRSHRCIVHRGVPTWPPVWRRIGGEGGWPNDETSVLEEAHPSRVAKDLCFLFTQCNGSRYIGVLQFDTEPCCAKACDFLARHVGETIATIGELEVDA